MAHPLGMSEDTPAGKHHTKKAFLHKHALKAFTTNAYSFKRLPCAFAIAPNIPFFRLTSCVLHTHTHLTRSTGFCAIWDSLVSVRVVQPAGSFCLCFFFLGFFFFFLFLRRSALLTVDTKKFLDSAMKQDQK